MTWSGGIVVRRWPNKKGDEIDPAWQSFVRKMNLASVLKASVISFILAGAATGLVQFALHLV